MSRVDVDVELLSDEDPIDTDVWVDTSYGWQEGERLRPSMLPALRYVRDRLWAGADRSRVYREVRNLHFGELGGPLAEMDERARF